MEDNPFLQGEIIAKDEKYTEHFKNSSEPASQFQSNLIQNNPRVKEFEIAQIKDHF
jgi:hypothetical protein